MAEAEPAAMPEGEVSAEAAAPAAEPLGTTAEGTEATPQSLNESIAEQYDRGLSQPPPAPELAATPVEPPIDPPTYWDADAQERFRALPRQDQEWLLARTNQQDQAYAQASQQIAPLQQVFGQWAGYAQQIGTTPELLFNQVMQFESALRSGTPAQKQNALGLIAQQYGIPYQPVDPNPVPLGPDGQPDEAQMQIQQALQGAIGPLQQQVQQLTQFTQQQQQTAHQQTVNGWMTQIEAFAAEKNEQGQPAHPYFDEVMQDMGRLAQVEMSNGGLKSTLPQLYEQAIWASPTVRPKLLNDQKRTIGQQNQQQVAAARRAGASITGNTGGSKAGATTSQSLRDQIERAYAASEG